MQGRYLAKAPEDDGNYRYKFYPSAEPTFGDASLVTITAYRLRSCRAEDNQ